MPTRKDVVAELGEWLDWFSVEEADGVLSLYAKPGDWVPDDVFKPLLDKARELGGSYDGVYRAVRIPVEPEQPRTGPIPIKSPEFVPASKLATTEKADLLANPSAAKQVLAKTQDFNVVKKHIEIASTGEFWAKARNDNEAALRALEYKLQAWRRAGQVLQEMKNQGVLREGRPQKLSNPSIVSLKTLGITLDESHQWQRIADVTEEEWPTYVIKAKKKTQRDVLTLAGRRKRGESKGPYVSVSGVEWTDYALNIYLGCHHDCEYCYAKRMNDKTGWVEEWTKPRKREIDLEALSKELDKLDSGTLFFCSITDAYQPLNSETGWAKQVLSVLLSKKHITTLILTKSAAVEQDLTQIAESSKTLHNVKLGFTITNLDDEYSKTVEPGASPPSERVRVLRLAHEMSIPTFVSIEPWIVGRTFPVDIIQQIRDCVDEWIIGAHNYGGTGIEDYQSILPQVYAYLAQNGIKYRMKAELDRAFKSNPVLSKDEYAESAGKGVGQQ